MTSKVKQPTAWVVEVLQIPTEDRGGHPRSKQRVFYSLAEAQGYLAAIKRPARVSAFYDEHSGSTPAGD